MLPAWGLVPSWRVDAKTSNDQRHPRDRYLHACCRDICAPNQVHIDAPLNYLLLDFDFGVCADVFALASSILTSITGGETDLQTVLNDQCILDTVNESHNIPAPGLFGLHMNHSSQLAVGNWLWTFSAGYYVAGILMLIAFIWKSAF